MDLGFYRQNARWLGTGYGLALTSSFGQTFFLALFAGEVMAAHGITDGTWGTLYTAATLTSAFCLVQVGKLVDTVPIARVAAVVLVIYALAAVGMAASTSLWLLLPVVGALRFCGQGMMSHLAMTSMARWFAARRGQAVAFAGLGFSTGEALIPILAVAAAGFLGWRGVWLMAAAILLCLCLPVFLWLLNERRIPQGTLDAAEGAGMGGRHWTRGEVLRFWAFWAMIPGLLAPGFIGTVAFFHLAHVSAVKGWPIAEMTLGYPAYAGLTVLTSFAMGAVLDRVGALRLLPVYLLPMGAGIALLDISGEIWSWYAMLALFGVTQGGAIAVMGALWAELYGTRHLGAVRALGISVMVVSTAIGPGVTGLLIDAGIPFPDQGVAMGLWCVLASVTFASIAQRLRAQRAAFS
ncbi:MAG: MFS transporter [Pseudomonadota bacterium]